PRSPYLEPRILFLDSSSLIPVPCFPIQRKGFGNQEFTNAETPKQYPSNQERGGVNPLRWISESEKPFVVLR
ncbi:hypothetical protein N9046_07745, partial [Akkermansiaceae bacterium]|nr:hypothetical protein [Akkermansiaceae bacterium]